MTPPYTLADLDRARAALAAEKERWADYTGNNPNKRAVARRSARLKVDEIEAALKASGVLPWTERELLHRRLDAAFPDAASRQVVEFEGRQYERWFMPADRSRSGRVTSWERGWKLLSDSGA